jgi:uncharacterized protein
MAADSGQHDDPGALRAVLRRDLASAMKARESEAVAALRTAIAAIDNAEAVAIPAAGERQATTSSHFAGARAGVGATEAARRELGSGDIRAILDDLIAGYAREADGYDTLGHADAARRLRNQARLLAAYLS